MIGFPALPGSFVYNEVVNDPTSFPSGVDNWNGIRTSNEFTSGYFLEGFGEVSTPINWWARIGAFIKYNGVYGRTTMDVNTTVTIDDPNVNPTDHTKRIPNSRHNQAVATFQRSSWIFGGSVSASF